MWQANWVKSQLQGRHRDLSVELVKIKTKGDKILDQSLSKVGGKGLFVKEIEDALISRETDIAVHSMKDVPVKLPDGLIIGAVPEREDLRDAFISAGSIPLKRLRQGARIGTSSLRRQSQLLHLRPDIAIVPIRGNVETRIKKIETEGLDGVILAAAGLKRLRFEHKVTEFFEPEVMLPAIGQGALAIEIRDDDDAAKELIGFLDHEKTRIGVTAERSFLRTLEGGCQVPIAAWARVDGESIHLIGMVADVDGGSLIRDTIDGTLDQAEALGGLLAERLLEQGARAILDKLLENE